MTQARQVPPSTATVPHLGSSFTETVDGFPRGLHGLTGWRARRQQPSAQAACPAKAPR
jgi:hypothetical protein